MHGGTEHEAILDLIRFDVVPKLRRQGLELLCILDDNLMAHLCGTKRTGKKDSAYPDMILMDDTKEYSDAPLLLVEVGQYAVEKWPEEQPVLHVGMSGRVSLINASGSAFEILMRNAIAGALTAHSVCVSVKGCYRGS